MADTGPVPFTQRGLAPATRRSLSSHVAPSTRSVAVVTKPSAPASMHANAAESLWRSDHGDRLCALTPLVQVQQLGARTAGAGSHEQPGGCN